nr:MAG TPA: hypothetical protein [Bacteriophage sp.]
MTRKTVVKTFLLCYNDKGAHQPYLIIMRESSW